MAAGSFTAEQFDPYKNFKFRVRWDGRHVAGFNKVGALRGANGTRVEPITLEGGVTHDADFETWANTVPGKEIRRDIIIEVYGETGHVELSFTVYRCWVSEYLGLPDLDTNGNAAIIESLKLEHEGWARGDGVSPTAEEPT